MYARRVKAHAGPAEHGKSAAQIFYNYAGFVKAYHFYMTQQVKYRSISISRCELAELAEPLILLRILAPFGYYRHFSQIFQASSARP